MAFQGGRNASGAEFPSRARFQGGASLHARDHVQQLVRLLTEFLEDQWFDRSRGVRTSGNVSLQTAGIAAGQIRDSEFYEPARPAHIRRALREMPIQDVSSFSYVDLGCGKGRSLFVAAELPFRQIIGVEFSPLLHEQSCANIRRFRPRTSGCRRILSLHQDAKDFAFPEGNIVLYLFNPFGAATMQSVLDNLDTTRKRHPCHVIIILLWPRCADQVAAMEGMHLRRHTREYQIFEARPLSMPD